MSVHPYTIHTSVRPQKFSDFDEIWYVVSRQRSMSDTRRCDPIQGQDHQGHGGLKGAEMADFSLSLPLVCM